ncbi:MAG: hypothetical protein PHY32_00805 [Candidatus Pacebacteria bacterium]|nr:hypothetical protein [Candidatus Paceibacterota bacterium]
MPPEEPIDPGQPTPEDRYVCDFTSQSYNNLYNCIVASGPVKPGELVCDVNTNKETPVTQEVEKTFL